MTKLILKNQYGIQERNLNFKYDKLKDSTIYAHFLVMVNYNSEILIKTKVIDLNNNNSTIYFFGLKVGKVKERYGISSGAFAFKVT